jgi:predicted nucleic acid-binding protein
MSRVLLDTGFIVAVLDRSEARHEQCAGIVVDLESSLVTCEAVIAESCYLLRDVHGAAEAVLANVAQGVFELSFRLSRSARAVQALMRRYANVPMDFADACLVQMADELGTGEIVTLDPDFAIYRWRRKRRFANLVAL